MFWRILGQLFSASRGRLAVALLALASGAAVTTALINLNLDAERKLTAEFRTLGANVIVEPHLGKVFGILEVPNFKTDLLKARAPQYDSLASPLLEQVVLRPLAPILDAAHGVAAPYLYLVANAHAGGAPSAEQTQVIVAGTWLDRMPRLSPWWKIKGDPITDRSDLERCLIGRNVAQQLGVEPGSHLDLSYASPIGNQTMSFAVAGVINSGGQEDNQVIVNLSAVQQLAALPGEIGFLQISIPGTPHEIETAISRLSAAVPAVDIHPVPQIAQAEASLLPRIRGLIFFMVALILVLTTLCVFASMAALAMERRRDVGLMKAIGGSISRIVRIFFTEAAALGLTGALIGYVAGIFLSRWIGERAFHVAISARPEVLPIVVALMVVVSLAGALPLRLLGRVRPAEILRGE
jgi:putative ABC transport system permease protein